VVPDFFVHWTTEETVFMSRIGLAWRILTDRTFAAKAAELLTGRSAVPDSESSRPVTVQSESPKISEAPTVSASGRSDALTLLATLQREARLVDFLKEPSTPTATLRLVPLSEIFTETAARYCNGSLRSAL
jgi:hypothetical protein